MLGLRTKAIDAPSGHTLIVAYSNREPAIIRSGHFDHFIVLWTAQFQGFSFTGKNRLFSRDCSCAACWKKKKNDQYLEFCLLSLLPKNISLQKHVFM